MKLLYPAVVLLIFLLTLFMVLAVRQARRERIEQLANDWNAGELAIAVVNCRTPGELYLGVPCDEILEAYELRH